MSSMEKKAKQWTYATSHSFTALHDGKEIKCFFQSQVYSIGIYVIYDNNPGMQGSASPDMIIKMQSKLRKAEQEGNIKDLQFGRDITVTMEDGFYKEVTL